MPVKLSITKVKKNPFLIQSSVFKTQSFLVAENEAWDIAKEYAALVREVILMQLYNWRPLSEKYADWKEKHGFDPRILIMSMDYVDNVKARKRKGGAIVVGPPNRKHRNPFTGAFDGPNMIWLSRWLEFGCLSGDTRIALLDGTDMPIKDLVEQELWVYAYGEEDGKIHPAKATAFKTKDNSPLVKVILDNGEGITCTPEHPFYLRDGTQCQAKDLKEGTSLMPLYKKLTGRSDSRRGYELIMHPVDETYEQTHQMVVRECLGDYPSKYGWVAHHTDFNKRNNDPRNIEIMGKAEHFHYHSKVAGENNALARKWKNDPAWAEKEKRRVSAWNKERWEDSDYREKMSQAAKERWKDPDLRKRMGFQKGHKIRPNSSKGTHLKLTKEHKEALEKGRQKWWENGGKEKMLPVLRSNGKKVSKEKRHVMGKRGAEANWKKNEKAIRETLKNNSQRNCADTECVKKMTAHGKEVMDKKWQKVREENLKLFCIKCPYTTIAHCAMYNHLKSQHNIDYNAVKDKIVYKKVSNHKVVSVEVLSYREDVYCLEVEKYGNFALSSGIFVHNTKKMVSRPHFRPILAKMKTELNITNRRLTNAGLGPVLKTLRKNAKKYTKINR